jgi:phosphotransferase system enzyme I (PtsP)
MLKTLRHIVQEVSRATDLKAALDILVIKVRDALDAQACAIFLLDEQTAEYILLAAQGLNASVIGKARIRPNEGLIGLVGQREEPINLDDAPQHPRFLEIPDIGEEAYHAFLGVPIIHQRRVLGVLLVQRQQKVRFDESEEALLVTLSAQLAAIIALAESTGMTPHVLSLQSPDTQSGHDIILSGLQSAPGIGIGTAVVVYPPADLDVVPEREAKDIALELDVFNLALEAVREDVMAQSRRLETLLPAAEHALFDAYVRMLDNDSLGDEIRAEISTGQWAQGALKRVMKRHISQFQAMEDDYLRERATDVKDIGLRILAQLQESELARYQYPERTILVGEEITATALADVPAERLVGVVSATGSNNSHVAIVARALGVPTVMGATGVLLSRLDGLELIVDGYYGQVYVNPSSRVRTELLALAAEEQELDANLEQLRHLSAVTRDKHRIAIHVNTGFGMDAGRLLSSGADGVGLYRTEEPFMLRERFPAEEEQRVIYRQLLGAFAPRPVVMRTLDVGGDKNLSYFPIQEKNPFLGWRGIRITLDHPELLLMQIRAMLRASEGYNNLKIMFPMISGVTELVEAKSLFMQAYQEVVDEGAHIIKPELGVMIEVPSAVYQIRELAKRVDFISVGSNDLTQYLLAVDRNNSRVANLFDSYHPSVLQAMHQVVKGAHAEGRMVSICGELAGDPIATIALLGMQFDSLSMSPSSLSRVKWVIRNFKLQDAKDIVDDILSMDNPTVIRFYLEQALERAGMGSLLRAGKR